MKINYANRIAPEDRDYVCGENERLVTATNDKQKAGADARLNYTLYIEDHVQVYEGWNLPDVLWI